MAFRNAIFSGGGSRCFWQLGVWEGAAESGLDLRKSVRFVGSTSAGCAIATAAVLNRARQALELFQDMTAKNPSNIHWHNLSPLREAPVLPHARMYREALETFLAPEDLVTLRGFVLHFLMSGSPSWISGRAGTILGFSIYALEQTLLNPVHPKWTRRAGFRPIVGRAHDCTTTDELVDMVLAASCVPPVLPGGRHDDESVLDGGLIDDVPTLLAEEEPGETLVILSRRYECALPHKPGTTYVQPSEPVPIDKFDYANPKGLQDTFDLGYTDGVEFASVNQTIAAV